MPAFVESLDAVEVGKDAGMPLAPVMIYGDDVTHVVTEEGVAYLYMPGPGGAARRSRGGRSTESASGPPTGPTAAGRVVATPEDLGVRRTDARRSLLAARSIDDLVDWSGGLYRPPPGFGAGDCPDDVAYRFLDSVPIPDPAVAA